MEVTVKKSEFILLINKLAAYVLTQQAGDIEEIILPNTEEHGNITIKIKDDLNGDSEEKE